MKIVLKYGYKSQLNEEYVAHVINKMAIPHLPASYVMVIYNLKWLENNHVRKQIK